jgi:hypothetical protein
MNEERPFFVKYWLRQGVPLDTIERIAAQVYNRAFTATSIKGFNQMSDSTFDPNQFLDATTTEAATRRPPLTAGSDYIGLIGEPKVRQHQGKADPSKNYTFVDFPIELDLTTNPKERERIGRDTVNLQHSVGLELTDNGAIDWSTGHNGQMRAMREACGMNVAGQAFSIRGMQGRPIRVKVKHEEYPPGSGELLDRVQSVAKP